MAFVRFPPDVFGLDVVPFPWGGIAANFLLLAAVHLFKNVQGASHGRRAGGSSSAALATFRIFSALLGELYHARREDSGIQFVTIIASVS